MTQRNNSLSVLPFYNKLEYQHRFKPYAFGAVYPLIADVNSLIPFQFQRFYEYTKNDRLYLQYTYDASYLTKDGQVKSYTNGFTVKKYQVVSYNAVYLEASNNTAYIDSNAALIVAYDTNNNVLGYFSTDEPYFKGYWKLPMNTDYFCVQMKATGTDAYISAADTHKNVINKVVLHSLDGKVNTNITNKMADSGLMVLSGTSTEYDTVIFMANGNSPINAKEGQYYLSITAGDNYTWYSEVITLVNNIDNYLKVEWWDEENLVFDSGSIIYNGFKNTLYIDTNIGKPEYKFEEEGKERDGYFFAEKQLSEKVYKFIFLAPEFICDAFRFVRLSDNINIYKNGVHYTVDSLLAEVNWQDQGDLADVSVEFRTGTVVKKIAAAWPK